MTRSGLFCIALLFFFAMALTVAHSRALENDVSLDDKVPPGHWLYSAMDYVQESDVLEGYPVSYFGPGADLTGYEFAQAGARLDDTMKHSTRPFPPHVRVLVEDLDSTFGILGCGPVNVVRHAD